MPTEREALINIIAEYLGSITNSANRAVAEDLVKVIDKLPKNEE